jgi:hypothetical protein
VTSLDWASYPILTFLDVPDVDRAHRPSKEKPGRRRATAAVVPAAISNAVFDAIGLRLRSVPFVPQKVLAGLRLRDVTDLCRNREICDSPRCCAFGSTIQSPFRAERTVESCSFSVPASAASTQ